MYHLESASMMYSSILQIAEVMKFLLTGLVCAWVIGEGIMS